MSLSLKVNIKGKSDTRGVGGEIGLQQNTDGMGNKTQKEEENIYWIFIIITNKLSRKICNFIPFFL